MIKVKGSIGGKLSCIYDGINVVKCRSPSYQINIDKDLPKNFDGERPVVGGKDKLQFHSMKNDQSLMIERLSYSIIHHYLNISTARAVHCVLFLNGEKLGVFLNTEEIDEKSIGPILFGEKGTMYKDVWPFDYGPLSYANGVWSYVEIELMDELRNASLQCVSENQLEMKCTADEGRLMLKKYIDTDSYVKAMSANHLLNNFDGTPKSLHNHYWFQNKNNGPYVFVPWDYNNLIMLKLCKVNEDTGLIEGFGDIERNSAHKAFYDPMMHGVCNAPSFQYLPSTIEERQLLCRCSSGFNSHMTCLSAVSIVLSQSLDDDYFNYRDDAFKGNEINVKNEVKSMVEYWSNQIRTHINTSSIKYPMKYDWEEKIKKISLLFDYALDQLMNRKKELNRDDIDAHFELIKNGTKKVVGKCECQSDLDCKYEGCDVQGFCGFRNDGKCWARDPMDDECEGIEFVLLDAGWMCLGERKMAYCPGKKKSEVSTAESEKSEASESESKDIFPTSEASTAESKEKEKSEADSSQSKNVFSKTFGIA